MDKYITIFCAIPSKNEAKEIARKMVEKKLAACVNIVEGLTSVYEWKGKICEEEECLMIMKSREALFQNIKSELIILHPYETPEIISISITDGLDSYLKWIDENTKYKSD